MTEKGHLACRVAVRSVAMLLVAAGIGLPAAWGAPATGPGGKAQSAPSPRWIYPAIAKFGGVHPRADLPVRPDPKVNYRIFADIVSSHRDPAGHYDGLQRLARLVNLMAYAKVPPSHVHIVALLDEKAGYAAVAEGFFEKQFDGRNPNLPIIHALKKAGVHILICSQALAELDLPDRAVDPDVTITLSALTDSVIYGQRGYIYMQL